MNSYINTQSRKIIKLAIILFMEILIPTGILKYQIQLSSISSFAKVDNLSLSIFILFWIFLSYILGRYSEISKQNFLKKLILEFKNIFLINSVIIISLFITKIIGLNNIFDSKNIPNILFILNLFSFLKEIVMYQFFDAIFAKSFIKILFLGEKSELLKLKKILKDYSYKKIVKFKMIYPDLNSKIIPDQLIISNKYELNYENEQLIQNFLSKGVQVFSIKKWFEFELNCLPVELMDSESFINSSIFSNNKDIEIRIKRTADIIVSLLLLIITSPIILISSIIIWLTDRGPVIYKQTREGIFGQNIYIYKLRSMIINAEKNGPRWASKNDSRITPIGKLLRKTRIDELPQLISVFKGELSLIGPRPERPEFNKLLKKEIPHFNKRHIIKPGLSGWAQVNYPYGASIKSSKIKLSYDLYYIDNISLLFDLLIFLKTIKLIIRARGSVPNKQIT